MSVHTGPWLQVRCFMIIICNIINTYKILSILITRNFPIYVTHYETFLFSSLVFLQTGGRFCLFSPELFVGAVYDMLSTYSSFPSSSGACS